MPLEATMLDKIRNSSHEETRSKYACIVEAKVSSRKRIEGVQHRDQEDHIAGKGFSSLSQHNHVLKFIPMPQAMKILDAKAAVDKEWEKLKKLPA